MAVEPTIEVARMTTLARKVATAKGRGAGASDSDNGGAGSRNSNRPQQDPQPTSILQLSVTMHS